MLLRAPIPIEWKGSFLDVTTYQRIESILEERNSKIDENRKE